MDSVQATAPTLLPIAADLANLTVGISMHNITVRLMRMWEARNFKKSDQLMSLELLLLDNKGFAVTASIHHRRIPYYIGSLREGEIYELSNFEVVPAYERYMVTTARHSLRFTDGTQLNQLKDAAGDAHQIRNELFYTLTYEEYLTLANTCSKLPDVVGQILSIHGPNLGDGTSNQKIIILLRLAEGTSVRMTIWDQQSALFRQQFHKHGQSTAVVVCTSLNPKLFAGNLYLNTTGATKFYFDDRLDAVRVFKERSGFNGTSPSPTIKDETTVSKTYDRITVAQLLDAVQSSDHQEKEVICIATIVNIGTRNGWSYISCGRCSKKLVRGIDSFSCLACNNTNALGVLKFRVVLEVSAEGATTNFVLFDRDVRGLTNRTAEEISSSEDTNVHQSATSSEIPMCLGDLLHRTMEFQIKLTKYNYTTSHQTFTVTRVTNPNAAPPEIRGETSTHRVLGLQEGSLSSDVLPIKPNENLASTQQKTRAAALQFGNISGEVEPGQHGVQHGIQHTQEVTEDGLTNVGGKTSSPMMKKQRRT